MRYNKPMSYRASSVDSGLQSAPGRGLPRVNYYLPMIVTLLASILLLIVIGTIATITLLTTLTQLSRVVSNDPQASSVSAGLCGVVALASLGITIFFAISVVKGVRDLLSPVYYTRGTVADKRVLGGRRGGSWLGVFPHYAGSDQLAASQVDDEQHAASTNRSRMVQPRFASSTGSAPRKPSGYLSADRISAESAAALNIDKPRRIFRVDSASYKTLEAGEEVLIAHSRFLEHIFYVAHLKDGEWEAFYNKALI